MCTAALLTGGVCSTPPDLTSCLGCMLRRAGAPVPGLHVAAGPTAYGPRRRGYLASSLVTHVVSVAGVCAPLPGQFYSDWYTGPWQMRLNTTVIPAYAACCAACQQAPGCTRFTYWPASTLACRLFDTPAVELSLASEASSGTMEAPSPPPTAGAPPPPLPIAPPPPSSPPPPPLQPCPSPSSSKLEPAATRVQGRTRTMP